jgi:hypothetical protein
MVIFIIGIDCGLKTDAQKPLIIIPKPPAIPLFMYVFGLFYYFRYNDKTYLPRK